MSRSHRSAPVHGDDDHLRSLGYEPELTRRMGGFGNFAVSFSVISVLSGCMTLFGFGLVTVGPAVMMWGWVGVGLAVLLVGLSLAEVTSAYPTSGGLYFMAQRLGGPRWGWVTGWLNLLGLLGGIAGIDYGAASFIAAFASLQWGVVPTPGLILTIFAGVLVLHALLNVVGVRVVSLLNSISVWWHLAGVTVIVGVLAVVPSHHQDAGFVFGHFVNETGWSNPVYVSAVGLLLAGYTFCGYDASAHLSEETTDASVAAPRGIVRSIWVSLLAGFVLLAGLLFAVQDYAGTAGAAVPPAQIFLDALGTTGAALARVSAAPWGTASWKAYHQRFYERFGIGSMVPVTAVRLPPHLELGVRVHAASTADLERGRFQLEVVSVSRGAGVGTGRFLQVLDPAHRAAFAAELADLPAADRNTVAAQLSFPPLEPDTAHVTRTPRILPTVITMEEHQAPGDGILTLQDLAVGCDGRRMYLAAPALGHRVEAVAMHALNPHTHTPPLARFLTELSRAQCAAVTLFDWGAARTMPFLPRLRHGRTVLAPARWRLESTDLPARARPWAEWDAAFAAWRSRRRMPQQVSLTEGDRLLPLDLDEAGHRVLLRAHLDSGTPAVLTEAARDAGWCGGRAHEVVVPLKAVRPPRWPALPAPTQRRTIGRDHGQTPAASAVLLAGLYGDIRRQDTLLAQHLPDLLRRLGQPPWWYVRFRDPDQHLRLRIALPDPADFGPVAATVSSWADELHHAGLLREVRYPVSYPEWGRWGAGAAWDAVEDVFRADSRALLAQLRRPAGPDRRALVAAHSVAIAAAFLGSADAGADWIIENVPPAAPARVPRAQFAEAVRLADPRGDWAALRAVPGGGAIVEAWAERDAALAAYRAHLPGPDTHGIAVDDVLGSLLHVHFVRAVAVDFPEEAVCLYLARAAALAWKARTTGGSA